MGVGERSEPSPERSRKKRNVISIASHCSMRSRRHDSDMNSQQVVQSSGQFSEKDLSNLKGSS